MKRIRRSRKRENDEELEDKGMAEDDMEAQAVYEKLRENGKTEGRNLKLWDTIYEIAGEIEAMEPWNGYQMYMPIMLELRIHGEKIAAAFEKSPFAKNGKTIALYHGEKGLCDFDVLSVHDPIVPREFVMYDRDAYLLCWGSRQDVPEENRKILKSIGRSFRGDGKWLYFTSAASRTVPRTLRDDEAEVVMEALVELRTAIRDQLKKKIAVKYNDGYCLARYFDEGLHRMVTGPVKYVEPEMVFRSYNFNDEVMARRIKRAKQNDRVVDFDFFYNGWSPTGLLDENGNIGNWQFALAFDEISGNINLMMPVEMEVSTGEMAFLMLHDYVLEYGRMKELIVRNAEVYAALEAVCSKVGIPLVLDTMPQVDRLLNEIRSGI